MPAASSRQQTSWMPVPDAPTIPTGPRSTALANPSATPSRIAVPQSAPMNSSPRSTARRFSAASTSSSTPSEKQKTCRPASRATAASCATCSPGIERNARLATPAVDRNVRAAGLAPPPAGASPLAASSRSTADTAASAAASSRALIAITRSFGPAPSTVNPWSASSSRLSGVAIPTATASAPSSRPAVRETSISVTESWYAPWRTITRSVKPARASPPRPRRPRAAARAR
jgi:hypothetical protein